MGRVSAAITIAGRASDAEALWYDTARWPAFVDGLKHVARVEGGWPATGGRVLWDSFPGGRGRVQERVTAYEVRTGQTAAVEDERIRGTQQVRFAPAEGGLTVTLELDYALKDRRPGMWLVDRLFVRRPQRDSLARTLRRFAVELAAERDAAL
ncbi:MAG: SRPBCC family protein [Solirubrobacteraceae bacterium]